MVVKLYEKMEPSERYADGAPLGIGNTGDFRESVPGKGG